MLGSIIRGYPIIFSRNELPKPYRSIDNDTVSIADASSLNPTLLASSSFLDPSDQSDIYKTEKEEIFHSSKGDIVDR